MKTTALLIANQPLHHPIIELGAVLLQQLLDAAGIDGAHDEAGMVVLLDAEEDFRRVKC